MSISFVRMGQPHTPSWPPCQGYLYRPYLSGSDSLPVVGSSLGGGRLYRVEMAFVTSSLSWSLTLSHLIA